MVLHRHLNPLAKKDFIGSFELLDWVVIGHIVHFELVDNYKSKQVDHNELNYHNEHQKVNWRQDGSTIPTRRTIWAPRPCVVHIVVPTLTGCDNKHSLKGKVEV